MFEPRTLKWEKYMHKNNSKVKPFKHYGILPAKKKALRNSLLMHVSINVKMVNDSKKKSRHAQPLILALAGSLLLALIWRCLHKHVMRIESIQHLCSTPKGTCIYHRRYEAQINLQSPAAIPM